MKNLRRDDPFTYKSPNGYSYLRNGGRWHHQAGYSIESHFDRLANQGRDGGEHFATRVGNNGLAQRITDTLDARKMCSLAFRQRRRQRMPPRHSRVLTFILWRHIVKHGRLLWIEKKFSLPFIHKPFSLQRWIDGVYSIKKRLLIPIPEHNHVSKTKSITGNKHFLPNENIWRVLGEKIAVTSQRIAIYSCWSDMNLVEKPKFKTSNRSDGRRIKIFHESFSLALVSCDFLCILSKLHLQNVDYQDSYHECFC